MRMPRFKLRRIDSLENSPSTIILTFRPDVDLVNAAAEITWFYSIHSES